jgi:hypothetical protein
MTSFLRISDIPADELYLLPIIGLRQQIREDRSPPSSSANANSEQQTESPPLGPAHHAGTAPRKESPAADARFVTDWQLQDEPCPSASCRFDKEGLDDEDRDDEGLDEDFDDSLDEHAGEGEDRSCPNEGHIEGETFDALYVDLGGEG